jgi:hypothetical protein
VRLQEFLDGKASQESGKKVRCGKAGKAQKKGSV